MENCNKRYIYNATLANDYLHPNYPKGNAKVKINFRATNQKGAM